MAKEIDERVVSMQFDNKEFEKNVSQSLKTIQNLNNQLNDLDGGKGFEKLADAAKKVDLSKVNDSVNEVTKSFSKMDIVTATVINRLTNSLINFGVRGVRTLYNSTFGLINKAIAQAKSGGLARALNIEQAQFMLEGLKMDVEEVSANAMAAVDGTAYGFDEAAKAASTFGASGVKAGEEMTRALTAVSGVAAMTGRSYSDIANIFSTVAGNGKLMTMQLRQFSASGLNVSAELAKQMGTTEQAINDMVTKGEISFTKFADAMYEAFGEHAKDANKTFNGSLSNMKAALSRIGADFAAPFNKNMIPIFNAMKGLFNDLKKAMAPIYHDFERIVVIIRKFVVNLIDNADSLNTFRNIVYGIRHVIGSLILILYSIGRAFKNVFKPARITAKSFYDLTLKLVPTEETLNRITSVFTTLFSILKGVSTILSPVIGFAWKILVVLGRVLNALIGADGVITNFFRTIKANVDFGKIFEKGLSIIAAASLAIGAAFASILASFKEFISNLEGETISEKLASLGDYIIAGLLKGIKNAIKTIKKTWTNIFNWMVNTAKKILGIHSPSTVFIFIGAMIMAGLLIGLTTGWDTIKTFFAEKAAKILEVMSSFGSRLAEVVKGITAAKLLLVAFTFAMIAFFRQITRFLKTAGEAVSLIATIKTSISTITDSFRTLTKAVNTRNFILGLAAAIAVFAACVVALAYLPWDQVWKAAAILGGFVVVAVAYVGLISKINPEKANAAASAIAALGVSMAGFAISVSILQSMNIDNIGGFIASIIAMLFFLVTSGVVLVKLSKNVDEMRTSIFGLIGFAIALNVLVKAFQAVLLMGFNVEQAIEFLIGIIAVVQVIGILNNFISKANDTKSNNMNGGKKFGIFINSFAVGLGMVVIGVGYILSQIDKIAQLSKNQLTKGLLTLLAVFTFIVLVLTASAIVNHFSKGAMEGIGQVLKGFSMMMLSMIAIVYAFKNIEFVDIGMPMFMFMEMLAGFVLILGMIKLLGSEKKVESSGELIKAMAKMMLKMTASIIIMVAVFGILDKLGADIDKIAWNVGSLIIVLSLMATLLVFASNLVADSTTENIDKIGKFIRSIGNLFLTISVAISILVGTFGVLSAFDVGIQTIMTFIVVITIVIGALVAVWMHFAKLNENQKGMTGTILSMSVLLFSLYGMMAVLTLFAGDDWKPMAAAVLSMVVIMGMLALLFSQLSKIKYDPKLNDILSTIVFALAILSSAIVVLSVIAQGNLMAPLVAMIPLVVTLVVFSGVLKRLEGITVNTSTIIAMAAILLEIGVIVGILSMLPDMRKAVMAAISLGIVMVALGTMMKLIGKSGSFEAAVIILSMSVAVIAIAGALAVLSQLDWPDLLVATGVLALLTITLGAIMKYASTAKPAQFLAMGVGLLLMATGITALVVALSMLAPYLNDVGAIIGLIAITTIISALIVGVLALVDGLAALAVASKTVLVAIAAVALVFIGLATVFLSVGVAFKLIADSIGDLILKFGEFNNALDISKIEASTNALLKFGTSLANIGGGLISVSVGLLAFAGGAAVCALGAVVLAAGLIVLGGSALIASVGILALALALAALILVVVGPIVAVIAIMEGLGENILAGLTQGLGNGFDLLKSVWDAIVNFLPDWAKKILGIHSPSTVFRWIGDHVMNGFIQGLIEKFPALEKVFGSIADTCYDIADDLEDAGDNWGDVIGIALENIQEKVNNFKLDPSNLLNQLGKIFGINLGDMEAQAHAGDLVYVSDDEEGGGWKQVYRWQAEGYDSAQAWKDANSQMSLLDQLLNEFGIDVDDVLPDAEALTGEIGDMGSAMDLTGGSTSSLTSKLDSLKDSIADTLDIFTEFNDEASLTGRQVLRTFLGQLDGVTKWSTELQNLAKRGLNKGILEQLSALGPSGYEKVHAFTTMTTAELSLANEMYTDKLALTNSTANAIMASFAVAGAMSAEEFAQAIQEGTITVEEAAEFMGSAAVEALRKSFAYEDAIATVEEFQDGIKSTVANSISLFDEVKESEEISAEQMLKNMKDQVKRVGKWATNLKTLAARGISEGLLAELQALGPEGADKVEAFVKMSDSELKKANSLYETSLDMPDYISNKLTKSYAEAGFSAIMGFVDGINNTEEAEAVVKALATTTLDVLKAELDIHSPSRKMAEIGVNSLLGFVEGMNDQATISSSVSTFASGIVDAVKSFFDKKIFVPLGEMIPAGITEGIKKMTLEPVKAIERIAQSIPQTITKTLKIHSPSEVIADLCVNIPYGVAEGIARGTSEATDATERSVDDIYQSMREQIGKLANNESLTDANQLTIKPVLDWDSLDEQLNGMNERFAGKTIDISGNIANAKMASVSGNKDNQELLDAISKWDNREILDEMRYMRNDISTLQAAISSMTVSMDGTTVGRLITPSVDKQLGTNIYRNRRGKANG